MRATVSNGRRSLALKTRLDSTATRTSASRLPPSRIFEGVARASVRNTGLKASAAGVARTEQAARIEPPGPAGACHRAGQRPVPVGRPDDKLSEILDCPINGHH